MENGRYKVALSGSSARKIKRGQANLLAGRAVIKNMFPLTMEEVKLDLSIDQAIYQGSLPVVVNAGDDWKETLEAYCLTYLREEIQAEAAARNLGNLSRFLQFAALTNGQVTNISSLSRDAGVQRPTVQGYFQILQDTLVGHLVPGWQPRSRVKEQSHPKFYWFDTGVARAMSGNISSTIDSVQRGSLFETFILQELRAYLHYRKVGGALKY